MPKKKKKKSKPKFAGIGGKPIIGSRRTRTGRERALSAADRALSKVGYKKKKKVSVRVGSPKITKTGLRTRPIVLALVSKKKKKKKRTKLARR